MKNCLLTITKFIITKVYLWIRFIKEVGLITYRNMVKRKSVDFNACADRRTNVQTLDAFAETSFSTLIKALALFIDNIISKQNIEYFIIIL